MLIGSESAMVQDPMDCPFGSDDNGAFKLPSAVCGSEGRAGCRFIRKRHMAAKRLHRLSKPRRPLISGTICTIGWEILIL